MSKTISADQVGKTVVVRPARLGKVYVTLRDEHNGKRPPEELEVLLDSTAVHALISGLQKATDWSMEKD